MDEEALEQRKPLNGAIGITILFSFILICLDNIPSSELNWRVPEGLPHQGGFPIETPGLRPLSLLELYFVQGAPEVFSVLIAICLFLGVFHLRYRVFTKTSWITPLLPFFAAYFLVAPLATHRCQSPETACRSNIKNIVTAAELYRQDNGRYPTRLEELAPNYLRNFPDCPLTGRGYSLPDQEVLTVRCRPHPPHYSGNDISSNGNEYMSFRSGNDEVFEYVDGELKP